VQDQDGKAAQGVANPRAHFQTHYIVAVDGKYYDPSYGGDAFESSADWEAKSVAGFAVQYKDVVANPNLVTRWLVKKNTDGVDLDVTETDNAPA
jgi:hypothetical protein